MHRLIDKALLLVYCFANVLLIKFHTSFVIAFFISIALSASIYFFHAKRFSLWITLIYGIVAYFYPPLYLFLPLVLYDILQYNNMLSLAVVMIGSFLELGPDMNVNILYIVTGCVFAFILEYKTMSYELLERTFKRSRDDSTELNLLLSEKNKNLLEKQDYEIYTATLRERNRIAREIHDNVGHMLSRSLLMVGALKAINQSDYLKDPLDQLNVTLSSAMDNIRNSVHDLHDESINLKEVIDSLMRDFTFCSITVDYDMQLDIPKDIKYCFITITKEALSNIMKHSNASNVHILMREHPGLYQLLIEDNGTSISTNNTGMGLSNMKERVFTLHGNIQIRKNNGFRIFITIPKTERIDI